MLQRKIAIQIEADILSETFDPTLNKYRSKSTQGDSALSLVQQFEKWVITYRNMDCDKNVDYHATRNMLKRWQIHVPEEVVYKFSKETFNERTYNKRLKMLRNFFDWLTKNGLIQGNSCRK